MYRREVPLLFPDDEAVARVQGGFFDPFEYLMKRHADGLLDDAFRQPLGKVAYHAVCHQRIQNFGAKTRDLLNLVPDTEIEMIARCSGHDGTYAVKSETYAHAMKIVRPVARTVLEREADRYGSDCPMAGRMIRHAVDARSEKQGPEMMHPISMLRFAYDGGLGDL